MRWSGETLEHWPSRVQDWHKHYCWFPTQMRDGSWVWLETVWRKFNRYDTARGFHGQWTYSDALIKPEEPRRSSSVDPKE